jgi:hypothetical protein
MSSQSVDCARPRRHSYHTAIDDKHNKLMYTCALLTLGNPAQADKGVQPSFQKRQQLGILEPKPKFARLTQLGLNFTHSVELMKG